MSNDEGEVEKVDNSKIYQNANDYRLHADILRWTLSGSFFAIYGIALKHINNDNALIFWIISMLFLFSISVQQWFYNLYASHVKDCEERIEKKENLITLNKFAKKFGWNIKLGHPSFSFILIIEAICNSILLSKSVEKSIALKYLYSFNAIIHIILVIIISKNWDRLFYKKFIKKLSNLFGENKYINKYMEFNEKEIAEYFVDKDIKELYLYDKEEKKFYLKNNLNRKQIKYLKYIDKYYSQKKIK